MAGGRPTKYDPKYCEELINHMADGFTLEAFAGKIRVHRDTLHAWSQEHPEFSDAIKIGKCTSQYKWEQKLHEAVQDKNINIAGPVFVLKTRHGHKETVSNEHSGPDGKPIQMDAKTLTDEQIDARVAALLGKGKPENG